MSDDVIEFGGADDRAIDGSLIGTAVGRLVALLRGGGVVCAAGLGGAAAYIHPATAENVGEHMGPGYRRVLVFGSLGQVQTRLSLSLAEVRTLEALSPGALILALGSGADETLAAIPDSPDVRQIAESLNGPLLAFIQLGTISEGDVVDHVRGAIERGTRCRLVGLLQPQINRTATAPTVARVAGPGQASVVSEGGVPLDRLVAASNTVSQWEIEDWT